jgi:hypothetical protein
MRHIKNLVVWIVGTQSARLGIEAGYSGRINASPVTGGENQVTVGLNDVEVCLVFDFTTQSIGNEDGEGVGSGVYEGSVKVMDTGIPGAGKPIVGVFFTVGVNKLRFNI